jgi:hypothetical protein
MDYRRNGGVVLLCTWHQQFFSAILPFNNYKTFNPNIMISQSRNGEIVAKMPRNISFGITRNNLQSGRFYPKKIL